MEYQHTTANSNRFGSIRINFNSSGVCLHNKLTSIALSATDFPDPVDPATKNVALLLRSTITVEPMLS